MNKTKMRKLISNLMPLSYIITLPLLSLIYDVLNNSNRGVHSLVTDLDKSMPFLKVFIIPYICWYLFIVATLIYLCLRDRDIYYKTLITLNITMLICYVIYYFYQTTVPRPNFVETDLLSKFVGLVYSTDRPFNCFPSIHCLTSFIMIRAILVSKRKNWYNIPLICLSAIAIILSTLFVKQHVIMDVIGAIVLGDLVFKLVLNLDKERLLQWRRKPSLLLTMKKKLVT